MKTSSILVSVGMAVLASTVLADDSVLQVEKPWIFAVPPGAKDTAAFMTLVNPGTTPIRLTGGSSPAAGRVAPMITTKTDGRMGMQDVDSIEVPAGGRAVLKPGGDHLMIYDLKAPLKSGQTVQLTLTLDPGGSMTIEVPVSRLEPK